MLGLAAFTLLLAFGLGECLQYGSEVGALSELQHGVRGRLYAVDSRTVYLKDFNYDGVGPAAYFYVGTSKTPSARGAVRLRDERGGTSPLRKYRGESITLSLPDGSTLKDYAWFSVWCDDYSVNFGSVEIPKSLEYPKPAKVGALRGVHGVSSDPIVVVDAQTLLIPNFSYDGEAPDAKFWVGRGDKPSPQGIRIPDENGKETPLRKYDKKTIVLTLPGELTVFDIGHFAIWCEAFTVNFAHVTLPRAVLSNVPPSLKMLGVSPQSRNKQLSASTPRETKARGTRPIPRLEATTYRPSRLGAALPLLDHSPAPSHLQRRADQYVIKQDNKPTENKEQKVSTEQPVSKPSSEPTSYQEDTRKYEVEIEPQTFTLLYPETQELLTEQYFNEQRRRALQAQYFELLRQQRDFDLRSASNSPHYVQDGHVEQARLAQHYQGVPISAAQDYRFDLDPFGRSL
ncbi:protein Skeletor, isoforms B/C isoform X4 [Pieris rapae]|uniref:protein Skeletor, isoforms B/C isoform X4 n=1 Tax=Pieris rapae TaxID=64459 RepID=UPI001E27C9C0|nr:protein Skeletor, isoforms B/C isoform X4 [Pieris rapae]